MIQAPIPTPEDVADHPVERIVPLMTATDTVLLGAALDHTTQTMIACMSASAVEAASQVDDFADPAEMPLEVLDAQAAASAVALRLRHRIAGQATRDRWWQPLAGALDRLAEVIRLQDGERDPPVVHARQKVIDVLSDLRLSRVI